MTRLIKIAGWSGGTRLNVVFVHGLGGDAYRTWQRAPANDTFWPLWLARDVPGLTVWTLAYDAPPSNWLGTSMPTQDRAKNVLDCLAAERELRDAPAAFICHSLGGLIVKQVLRTAAERRGWDSDSGDLIERVKGVVFIATPHAGSIDATFVEKLRLVTWPSASTLDLLKNDANLRDLNIWYRNWATHIEHKVFYEKRDTALGLIVDAESSDPGLLHVDPIAIDADHKQICKPANPQELIYVSTKEFLVEKLLGNENAVERFGESRTVDLPKLSSRPSHAITAKAARLAVLMICMVVAFKGMQALLLPSNRLNPASVVQIESALRHASPRFTSPQIAQFMASLRKAQAHPAFAKAVAGAKKGNTRVAEAVWRQAFEAGESGQEAAPGEQAEAARSLAVAIATHDVAQGLYWFRKATSLDPNNAAGWSGLGSLSLEGGGTTKEAEEAYRRCIDLGYRSGDERQTKLGFDGLGDVLSAKGHLPEALNAYHEGLAIGNRLATEGANPDSQRDLAVSYEKIGGALASQGNLVESLRLARDAQAIFQRLAAADPANADLQSHVAKLYGEIGDILLAQGHLPEALKQYQDYFATVNRLGKADPDNSGWQHESSVASARIAEVTAAQGDLPMALKSYRDAQAIFQRLAVADPGNADTQRELLFVDRGIGDLLVAQGDLPAAIKSYHDGFTIADRLTTADSGDASWRSILSSLSLKIGDIHLLQGDLSGALKSYHDSFTAFERLAKADPSNVDWPRQLSLSYDNIATVLSLQNDSEALNSYRKARSILGQLARVDPGDARVQHDLSVVLIDIGVVLVGEHDVAHAKKSVEEAVTALEQLTNADPTNADWQDDLSSAYEEMGDALLAGSDLSGALKYHRAAFTIRDRLARADPANAVWQSGLSQSFLDIGNVLAAQGSLAEALTSYRKAVDIAEPLAKADASHMMWQHSLSVAYAKSGSAFNALGDEVDALGAWLQGRALILHVTQASPEIAGWQQDLEWFNGQIDQLSAKSADTKSTDKATLSGGVGDQQR